METEERPDNFRVTSGAPDILQQFVGLFNRKGWLNRSMSVRYNGRNYRLLCSEHTFVACRINDNPGISPGAPGWVVCLVDNEQVLEDCRLSGRESDEPGVEDWLRYLGESDFERV